MRWIVGTSVSSLATGVLIFILQHHTLLSITIFAQRTMMLRHSTFNFLYLTILLLFWELPVCRPFVVIQLLTLRNGSSAIVTFVPIPTKISNFNTRTYNRLPKTSTLSTTLAAKNGFAERTSSMLTINLLSFDGGGIKGALSTRLLAYSLQFMLSGRKKLASTSSSNNVTNKPNVTFKSTVLQEG